MCVDTSIVIVEGVHIDTDHYETLIFRRFFGFLSSHYYYFSPKQQSRAKIAAVSDQIYR